MRSLIAWAISRSAGMNVIMLAVILLGGFCMFRMRREVFPEFELEVIMVSVVYPGATPSDIEVGICEKIEAKVRGLEHVKKVTSIAREGGGYVLVELYTTVPDVGKVLDEVEREVRSISAFPDNIEPPEVQQITFRNSAIRVGIIGPKDNSREAQMRLREVAERIDEELLLLSTVSSTSMMGAPPYQIDVEFSETTLRKYGLSLSQVTEILRRRNVELPGGQLKGKGEEIAIRAVNKGRVGEEIAKLPIITRGEGVVLTVGDLGTVRDEFVDSTNISEINGYPSIVISVNRTKSEDLLKLVEEVRQYVAETELPPGYRFEVWDDTSTEVRDRMNLLIRNGSQGLLLVFLVLTLFLEMRLAFWVALGIPISIFGAGIMLDFGDQTLNMLSMFSFLLALGIVVDDAIVIGENIYAHVQMGKTLHEAAVDGATEVLPSVITSVTTTVIAFMPMFFVSGVMGKFMAVIPFAVIAMLLISLLESTFVLPCHLAHDNRGFFFFLNILLYPLRPLGFLLGYASHLTTLGMNFLRDRVYVPILHFSLRYWLIPLASSVMILLMTFGMILGGLVPLDFFPKSDNNRLQATVTFPDGTPDNVSDWATVRMEEALRRVSQAIAEERSKNEQLPIDQLYPEGSPEVSGPVRLTFRQVGEITNESGPMAGQGTSGSHAGQVKAELYDTSVRTIHSEEILKRWREEVGEIRGAEQVTFGSVGIGPGGKPIEFKLLAQGQHAEELEALTEVVKERLADFDGVFDISDDNTPGKWEFQTTVSERAKATGVTTGDLGTTLRNAYYGSEVMRLQRGRHEVKLMVRYPKDERGSLANFQEIRVRSQDGTERQITELAKIRTERGYSEINRVNQLRSITISADVDPEIANGNEVLAVLEADLYGKEITEGGVPERIPGLLEEYPNVTVRWEGQREQTAESFSSLAIGFVVALLMMFILLVLQFRSYFQPLIIMAVIPFGFIGAVWGHWLISIPLTLFSVFGLVALAGVVVNDSIVLIDFINSRTRKGISPMQALAESGQRRFRPVMLTSITTIAGLVPLLMERSFQAQLLVPMAASLAFGLMLATALVLILVPVFYLVYLNATVLMRYLLTNDVLGDIFSGRFLRYVSEGTLEKQLPTES